MRAAIQALALAGLVLGCAPGSTQTTGTPEPGEWLPGGETTNTFLLGANAFIAPAENISAEHEPTFYSGNSFFNQAWVQAPSSTDGRDGLGPLFNARSCAACHFKDGRGRPPEDASDEALGLLVRLSVPGQGPRGAPTPAPFYGGQLQPFALPGLAPEAKFRVDWEAVPGAYGDGEPYTLRRPRLSLEDPAYGRLPADLQMSARVAPAVYGLGLLESIPEARLLDLEDPEDQNGDGLSGRLNRVVDARTGALTVGRFGWKAEQPSIRQQSAGAFSGDMGLTTSLFADTPCAPEQQGCLEAQSGGDPEVTDAQLDAIETYLRLLAVPVRTDWESPEVVEGKVAFHDLGCAGCHAPSHETSGEASLPELRGQRIWPYTDLLLHDLGPDLSDERPTYAAEGAEWRTPPLWGLRWAAAVNGHDTLMHDGRARGVAEAVLWHGGEAEVSREAFKSAPAEVRRALVLFVESL